MDSHNIGEYKIIEKVGQGGMGEVYKAEHLKLGQTVAIKMLSPEYSENESMRRRFLNEARIQAKFTHPNVVNIHNFFETNNRTYLVMEFVKGETLDDVLRRRGILQIEEALDISYEVINALAFMHSKGVIHRDIKPSNIMFTEDGKVKVTDFGIAKSLNENTRHTKTGVVGSIDYISPEQILGEKTTVATDIYSLGITLYKMLTGRSPFKGTTDYAIMKSRLEDKPIPPSSYNRLISKSLNKAILKAISRDPEDRYKSLSALSQSLRSVSKNKDNRLDLSFLPEFRFPQLKGLSVMFDSFFKTSIKALILIFAVAALILLFKLIPNISLLYLYIKEFLLELYLSIIR